MTMPPPGTSSAQQAPFELKGSLFTLTVLHLRRPDLKAVDRLLGEKVRQAPGFFTNAPAIIDLDDLEDPQAAVDFAGLYDLLRRRGIIPVGVRNGLPEQQSAAVLAGLPVMPEGRGHMEPRKTEPGKAETGNARSTKLVTQPVRSGQQIYAPDGDLILLGAVSPGAEVLADGNIHIYGRLQGRALAGAKGDAQARIFCQQLEAQLVSIAGHWRVIEDLDASARSQPVQIYLADDRLIIEPLLRQEGGPARGRGG